MYIHTSYCWHTGKYGRTVEITKKYNLFIGGYGDAPGATWTINYWGLLR